MAGIQQTNIFRIGDTAKELMTSFVRSFFTANASIEFSVPELRGYRWSTNPEERLVNIVEAFTNKLDDREDGVTELQYPMVLITYPEFSAQPTGVGSMLNKHDNYFISGPNSGDFCYFDYVNNQYVNLTYKTKTEQWWLVRRFYHQFEFNIDIISTNLESRQRLSDLVRVMWDQYLVELSPFVDLSVPFVLFDFQYNTKGDDIYPAFFPYGEVSITFNNPLISGDGDYDNIEIQGQDKLFVSTFSISGFTLEAFQFINRTRYSVNDSELVNTNIDYPEVENC